MIDISTNIAGVDLPSYIYNASGPRDTTLAELTEIGESESGAILTKSCTLEAREGNPLPRYQAFEGGSIQSMGLPNLGYKAYLEFIPWLKKHNKPVIISVSGLSIKDNVKMLRSFQQSHADLIEVNFSCPNIIGKPQLGYDFEQSAAMLEAISYLGNIPIGIKLPAYFDFSHYDTIAELINNHKVAFVTCINSIGNTLVVDPDKQQPLIKPKNGFGGLGGAMIKPIGLANVNALRQRLRSDIQIIGVGGIESGRDAFEYLLAGADAVQVGTCFQEQGAACFTRINQELIEVLSDKGYQSINEAKGQLRHL